MLKRNISIYIRDITLVQVASQELLSVLEKLGVEYDMSVETVDVEEGPEPGWGNDNHVTMPTFETSRDIEASKAVADSIVKSVDEAVGGVVRNKSDLLTSNLLAESWHNLATLKNPVTVIQSGVPVTAPEGFVDKRIGTADILSDGTANIQLSEHGTELFKSHQVVGLSITTLGPAKPANVGKVVLNPYRNAVPMDRAVGEKRDA